MKRKNMKVKSIMTAVCLAGVLLSGTASAGVMFGDMVGHWGESNVASLVEEGIVQGYPDGRFGPGESVNIDAFIKMAVESTGVSVREASAGENWVIPYYEKAVNMGIIAKADYSNPWGLSRPATRNEMVKILVKVVENVRGESGAKGLDANSLYTDVGNDDPFAVYIAKATDKGLISGYPEGTFGGRNGASRVEAAVMIHRVINPGVRVTKEQRDQARAEYKAREEERLSSVNTQPSRGQGGRGDALAAVSKYTAIIQEAERLKAKRVPYVYGGNSERGMDCSAFVGAIYRKAGINLTRSTRTQIHEGVGVSYAYAEPGDLIYFDTKDRYNGVVSHVGMYIGNNTMIHTGTPKDGIEYRVLSPWWRGRILAVKRHF